MSENIQQHPADNSAQGGSQQKGNQAPGCGCAFIIGLVIYVIVFFVTGGFGLTDADAEFYGDESESYSEYSSYTGQSIPRFDRQDARNLARALSQAEQRYDVCFGWKLTDGSTDSDSSTEPYPSDSFDRGSSRGPNTPASTCSRWVEMRVTVAYTSSYSERWSGVEVDLAASENLERVARSIDVEERLAELGMTAEQFIDAPVTTTGHAALAMPLLMAQAGAFENAPPPKNTPDTRPDEPLPPANGGSGALWTWIWLGALGAVTVLALALGFGSRARQKAATGSGGDGPPPPPGPPPGPPGPPQGGPPGPPPGPHPRNPPGGPPRGGPNPWPGPQPGPQGPPPRPQGQPPGPPPGPSPQGPPQWPGPPRN